ncbi:MAG: hypothetical protein WAL56_05370 [Candidatus Sulfotelmatobacter sp.]
MVKKYLLILATSGALLMAASFAGAQDSQSNEPPAPPSQEMGGGRHHNPPDPAQRTAELTKHLNLTADQQTKVQSALEAQRSQMESVHQDSSLSQQDRRAKAMDIHKATDAQIRGLLDSNQQKKWDEMQARREQRMQNRGGGPPDAQQGPPQN